ncbi:thiol-disulfide oxidoreductase DCC family protein [Evansella tamaricis]|uniref:Thiol-disulfide oxidoreductase DCC family protein n=1 Tax=Evansella tamaricis TaxID=2069301 RepID=A0ABS6JF77_9BACI|nr:thiol-disulfide oxidoreductase DCC family protein [Evansella tamaricis]MBU9710993.1 thiol-disulfide oxidoreductase DCC family protein [Evansella tamaricis]
MSEIILFDGVCNLCTTSVQFIIKRDPEGIFQFASLQSTEGQKLLKRYNINSTMDSFILIKNEKYYVKSSAALHVAKELRGGWKLLFPLVVIPPPIRNIFYSIVAKNRYRWFGKKEDCMIPTPEIRQRFLD